MESLSISDLIAFQYDGVKAWMDYIQIIFPGNVLNQQPILKWNNFSKLKLEISIEFRLNFNQPLYK